MTANFQTGSTMARPTRPSLLKIAIASAAILGIVLFAMFVLRWIQGAGSCWACGY